MAQGNRLSKLVKATSKFPQGIRSTLWSKAFGRVVPMVGSAKLRYLEVTHSKVVVKIENHKAMQNHIGQVHACAMALIAETATGFVTGMNVPDSAIVLIKTLKVFINIFDCQVFELLVVQIKSTAFSFFR